MDGLLNISYQEYCTVLLLLPKIEEQLKISEFFRSLDNLITLHQRMCVSFGCTLQIRKDSPLAFAWEQRKLRSTYRHQLIKMSMTPMIRRMCCLYQVTMVVNQIEFQGRSFAGVSVSNYGVVYPAMSFTLSHPLTPILME
jgi:type I restriction enzyme S subunit